MIERFKWWLWRQVNRLPNACPATSHSRIVLGIKDRDVRIGGACRRDLAANGICWCGKLRFHVSESETTCG